MTSSWREELDAWGGPRHRWRLLRAAWRDLVEEGPRFALRKASTLARLRLEVNRLRWTPRQLTVPLDSVEIDRPVFILGVQGAGITVLARCLYRHPKAVYATGNSAYWAGPDEIHNLRHIRGLPEVMVHRSLPFGNLEGRVEGHPVFGVQRSWLYAVDELLPDSARDETAANDEDARRLRRVLQGIMRAYAHDPHDCRFVDMSQLYTVQVGYLSQLLAGCDPRFVLVSRNPYATCARAAQKEYTPDRGGSIEDPQLRMRYAVEHWSNSYRVALACCDRVPMLCVRYEDFLVDPRATVQEICRFAELDFHESMLPGPGQKLPIGSVSLEKWWPLRPAENERYLAQIDPFIVNLLEQRAADVIQQLGYDLLGSGS